MSVVIETAWRHVYLECRSAGTDDAHELEELTSKKKQDPLCATDGVTVIRPDCRTVRFSR
jgi:hypothetical protein